MYHLYECWKSVKVCVKRESLTYWSPQLSLIITGSQGSLTNVGTEDLDRTRAACPCRLLTGQQVGLCLL